MNSQILFHTNSEYFDIAIGSLSILLGYGIPKENLVIVSDQKIESLLDVVYHIYNNETPYATRLQVAMENHVRSDNVILLHEDFLLYNKPNLELVDDLDKFLTENNEYDFIRFMKSAETVDIPGPRHNLWFSNNQFAIQATLFKAGFLHSYLSKYPNHSIWDLEKEAPNNVNNGLYWYAGEPRRGGSHFDSSLFPCMATAVHKGKWNSEYIKELSQLVPRVLLEKRGWI